VGQYPPQPERDPHWDVGVPSELPYTVASLPFRGAGAEAGAAELVVPKDQQRTAHLQADDKGRYDGSTVMLNNLVNNVVNWAANPLSRGGKEPNSSSLRGINMRSCSKISAPNPPPLAPIAQHGSLGWRRRAPPP